MFIVIEGPDGAGKSTLARWLVERLRAEGHPVRAVHEPGGTPVADAARKVVLNFPHDITAVSELFLILAARADLVEQVIRPALAAGETVVSDRYTLSTIAYQIAGRGLPAAAVDAALRLATGGLEPDLMLVLDVPVDLGRSRQRQAGKLQDRFEREDDAFHERVRDAYARARGPGVVHLDAAPAFTHVQEAAWRHIAAATTPSIREVT